MARYGEQIILSYDSDGAGQEAILRALEILNKLGCDARVIQMEGAKDPDEYIIKYGSGRFNLLVDNAISLVEFKIKMLKNKYNLENATDKVKFLKEITKILAKVENKIEREIYVEKVAEQYQISKEAIYAEVNKLAYTSAPTKEILNHKISSESIKTEEVNETIVKREKMETRIALIGIIVEDTNAVENVNEILHNYGSYIIGRMGIPYREKQVNIISIVIDAPNDVISSLSGKLGMIKGISVKTVYSKK